MTVESYIFTGSRNWDDDTPVHLIIRGLKNYQDETENEIVILEGDYSGLDKMAGFIARAKGLTVKPYPADWNNLGKKAGPIRNRKMLKEAENLSMVIGFTDDPPTTKKSGTWDMLRAAEAAGVTSYCVSHVPQKIS